MTVFLSLSAAYAFWFIGVTSLSEFRYSRYYTPQAGEQLKIPNLAPDKDYLYALTLIDFSGNTTTTAVQSFHTPVLEQEPPVILHHGPVEVGAQEVKIRVESSKKLSRVILTLIPVDTGIPQEFTFGSSSDLIREFTIRGLRAGLDYYYTVDVIDAAGNRTTSVVFRQFHTRVL